MANTIRLKRASGSDPGASDLVTGELAVRTDNGKLFTKKDDGSVAEVSGSGGGIDDGDKGDITVSNSGATFTIDNDAVTYAKIQNVSATNRILGRDSSGAGDIEEITPANLRTMINVEDGATADQSASEIVALIADQTIAPSTIDMEDNEKIKLGNDDDLEIYHSGSVSFIDDLTSGSDGVSLRGKNIRLQTNAHIGAESALNALANGAVELYYDNSKKLSTESDGIKIHAAEGGEAIISLFADEGDNSSDKFRLVASDSAGFEIQSYDGSQYDTLFKGTMNGGAELYHNNSKKFEVTSSGGTVTGTLVATAFTGDLTGDVTGNVSGSSGSCTGNAASADTIDISGVTTNSALQVIFSTSSGGSAKTIAVDSTSNKFTYNPSSNTLNVDTVVGNLTGDVTGNADTATNAATLDNIDSSQFVRSDEDDTVSGKLTFTSSSTYPIKINSSDSGKIILQGASDPYITFAEGTTNKAILQWNSAGYLRLKNQEDDSELRIKDAITFSPDGGSNNYTVWHANNDGAGSGLDADTVDGIEASSFIRSDADDTVTGEVTFDHGAGAVRIGGGSDIRFANGDWTGNTSAAKIQLHSNTLYLSGGSNGLIFRENDTDRWTVNGDGNFIPMQDSTYDVGSNGTRVRNGYFDTLYGDGSNLTNLPSGTANCTPSFAAVFSGNKTISSNSDVKAPFDSEDFDTDSAFDTSNNRFTVPSGKGGKYFFYVQMMIPNLDSGKQMNLQFKVNGTYNNDASDKGIYNREESGGGAEVVTIVVNAILNLSAGDYVEAFVYHNEGNSQSSSSEYARFGGFRFGT